MPRIDDIHWQADAGQNWTTLAAAVGCSRNTLLTCNGLPTNAPPALKVGQIVHLPFSAEEP